MYLPLLGSQGEQDSPKALLERLLTSQQVQEEWFAPFFLTKISISQIDQLLTNLRDALGAYLRVQEIDDEYLIVFERGVAPAKIALNQEGQITGLFFRPPQPNDFDMRRVLEEAESLSDRVSLLVLEDG